MGTGLDAQQPFIRRQSVDTLPLHASDRQDSSIEFLKSATCNACPMTAAKVPLLTITSLVVAIACAGGSDAPGGTAGIATVFDSTGDSVTEISTAIPAHGVVIVTTTGGMQSQSSAVNGYSVVDVALLIDDSTPQVNGDSVANSTRVTAINPAAGMTLGFARWSISYSLTLPAGNHTFGVAAAIVNGAIGAGAVVGGPAGSVLQGQLTVVVLKQ